MKSGYTSSAVGGGWLAAGGGRQVAEGRTTVDNHRPHTDAPACRLPPATCRLVCLLGGRFPGAFVYRGAVRSRLGVIAAC
jgi:hypothetical protein